MAIPNDQNPTPEALASRTSGASQPAQNSPVFTEGDYWQKFVAQNQNNPKFQENVKGLDMQGIINKYGAKGSPTAYTGQQSSSPIAHAETAQAQPSAPIQTPYTSYLGPSIVDALNSSNQNSSFAARSKLAKEDGIKNYSGTSKQNTEMLDKWKAIHQSQKGDAPPDSATARAAITNAQNTSANVQTSSTPLDNHMALVQGVNDLPPPMQNVWQQVQQFFSPQNTHQSFTEEYQSLSQKTGIPALETKLMNINNVMSGTEDEIRNEITKSGGFATESQVMALAGVRNKVLLKQASFVQGQLQIAKDYVDNTMKFSQADQSQMTNEINQKIGLVEKLLTIQDTQTKNAQTNYSKIIDRGGYGGLVSALQGDPYQLKLAEKTLGFSQGSLSDPAIVQKLDDTYKSQQIAQKGQQLSFSEQMAITKANQSQQKINITVGNQGINNGLKEARTTSAYASAINAAIKVIYPTAAVNPINMYQSSSQWINKLDQAFKESTDSKNTAKNVSDLALIDAAVKIDNGGQQITEGQVNLLLSGASIQAKATIVGGKIIGISGTITDDQRKEIKKLSTETYQGQKKLAQEGQKKINSYLIKKGIQKKDLLDDPTQIPQDQYAKERASIKPDEILVQDKNGQVGAILQSEFDSNNYTEI